MFVLTKSEQRVVILIVLILLAAAMVKHYREPRIHTFPTRSVSAGETATMPSPEPDE
jgi:hypothetical protein